MLKLFDRIKNAYGGWSVQLKASFWFAVSSIFQKGMAFITTPIFTRILSEEEYGQYCVYNSWYSIVVILATLNLSAGVVNNGLTKFSEKKNAFISSLQGLSIVTTVGVFVIYFVCRSFFEQYVGLHPHMMLIMFLQILFSIGTSMWSVQQRYEYKYKSLFCISCLTACASCLLGVFAVVYSEQKFYARVYSDVLVQGIVGASLLIYLFKRGRVFYDSYFWKYALNFNIPLLPHYLSMIVLGQSDRIMIERMEGLPEAAKYSTAHSVAMIMTIVSNAINTTLIPYTYKSLKEKKYDGIKKNADGLIVLVAAICVASMAFGPEIVWLMAPPEYYDARWIIPPVAASVYFMFLYPLFANFEFYFEKTKFIMVASCCGAGLNILLNYICIPLWGYYAAGYTTLFCYIVFSLAHFIAYKCILKKELKRDAVYNGKRILLYSLLLIAFMVIMLTLYYIPYMRYAVITIFLILGIIYKNRILNIFKRLKDK